MLGVYDYSESIIPWITATIGCIALAAGLQGWFLLKANIVQRIIFAVVGILMIIPGTITDLSGLGLLILLVFWQLIDKRKHAIIHDQSTSHL